MQHLLAKKPISFVLVLLLTMLLAVWSIGDVAQGANLTVTKTDDTNDGVCDADCSIREAIGDAAAGDTIDIPSGTYTLTLGSAISINKDLILIGAGPEGTIIQAATEPGVATFSVLTIGASNATVSGVTIRYGSKGIEHSGNILTVIDSMITGNIGEFGGGIGTSNTLTVLRSTISNNTSFREGGGIRNVWGSVEVIDSTISGNAAWRGGGISSENDDFGGTITVTNSTLSGNIATDSGGGIHWRTETFLFMTNSTITGNRAGSSGGGLYSASYPINLANTIIAGNTAPGSPDCFFDFFEGSNDGYNLIGDTRGCDFDSVESDLINVDPVLGPLQDNGGPTLTHALLGGSPAIDQIPSLDCEGTTDQRGVVRPQGSACDIGSYELEQAEFTVDSTDSTADVNLGDSVCEDGAGNCTLRAAVQEASALGGQNTINLPAGTYDLTYIITIKSDLAIVGAGAAGTIVVGDGNSFTVFDILSGTVAISDLTAQDGDQGISNDGTVTLTNVTVDGGNPPNGQRGGINNRGTLTLINSTVRDNFSYSFGAGIFNGMGATLTLINSTVSGNSTGLESDGGGIYNDYTGNVTLINSTVSGNEADNKGGGIYNSDGTLTLINSTVSNNEARSYGGIANEVYFEDAGVFMINTIVAQNTATEGPDCGFYGPLTSQDYNLIGNGRDCDFIAASGDLVGTDESPIDPLLGPLQDNGGPTETHALLEGSPAIDAIPVADCNDTFDVPITADQRGVTKPQGPACDMGAFELEQAEFTVDSTADVADANLGDGVCDDGSGNCTLRAANQEANALGGQNIINLPAGTYNLSSSIAIESDLTIFGAGPADTIIVGGGEFSFIVFEIL